MPKVIKLMAQIRWHSNNSHKRDTHYDVSSTSGLNCLDDYDLHIKLMYVKRISSICLH